VRERKGIKSSPHASAKAIVMGLLERGGHVRAKVIANAKAPTLRHEIRTNVETGSEIMTDSWAGYTGLNPEYVHQFVDHTESYVRGKVHTNGLENFWSLLKRALSGTYVNVSPSHLTAYLDEQAFRFNERHDNDGGRFLTAIRQATGKRLMYKDLIAKPA
jgi:transposase-like protein